MSKFEDGDKVLMSVKTDAMTSLQSFVITKAEYNKEECRWKYQLSSEDASLDTADKWYSEDQLSFV